MDMKQIEINGLLWDTENLEIADKKYYTWEEAMDAAKSGGKRLPTKEEFKALIKKGWEWDGVKKGMWFADDKLFFPLSGYMVYSSGSFLNTIDGYYWSSSLLDASNSWYLYFNSSNANVGSSSSKLGFSVRCVQDIQSDNLTIKGNNMENIYSQWKSASCEPPEDMQIVFVKTKCKNLLAGLGVGYKLPGRMAFEVDGEIVSYEDEYPDLLWTEVPK